jgi:acyl carrier protein/NAD(P)-dependent dehydrogenase (short-subunit alcohol dehydrogenase family)/2-polyprenyl-3-methyl-5-hydroxy-6-metoxy-1,4-benzoquinol methylase
MDGALQTLAGLVNDPNAAASGPMLPFSFDTVEWVKSPGQRAYAYVKKAGDGHRYHVAIVDGDGSVCVRLRDIMLREMKGQSSPDREEDPLARFFYAPVFSPRPLAGGAKQPFPDVGHSRGTVMIVTSAYANPLAAEIAGFYPQDVVEVLDVVAIKPNEHLATDLNNLEKIYFLGGIVNPSTPATDLDSVAGAQRDGVSALFNMVKGLGTAGISRRRLSVSVVTNRVLSIGCSEVNPLAAALHGFTGSMAKEFTQWDVNCLDIDWAGDTNHESLRDTASDIVNEPPSRNGDTVAFRNGLRYERKIELLTLPAPETTPFKERGVYVIAGGAGGIGFELCQYLVRQVQARVALLGRSPASESLNNRVSEIEKIGGEVIYLRTDITDPDSVRCALEETRQRFGPVSGVVHSAIVLRDRMIDNMDEETLLAALGPKVRGSAVLYDVFKNEPLDFMMFFSSAQSVTCNAGQSNYAAGCTFKDSFAHFIRRQERFPVKIVNWGYWGSVGIVSSSEYNQRLSSRGIVSIVPDEGMEAVRRIVAGPVSQVIPIKADTSMLEAMGIDLKTSRFYHEQKIPPVLDRSLPAAESLANGDIDLDLGKESTAAALREYMGLGLLRAFRRMGVLVASGGEYSRRGLLEQLRIIPRYQRLYHALSDILHQYGYVECRDGHIRGTSRLDTEELRSELEHLEEKRRRLSELHPDIAPHLRLLETCLNAYPDVLTGAVDPMSVMFPQGSMELVEDVYKGNDIVDFNNRHMGSVIKNAIGLLLEKDPAARVRILEVGAGTGGTSGIVCSSIASFAQSIDYVYTDISKKFAQHGKVAFGTQFPFMEFMVLDIETSPEAQGFETASFDIVLATNVIHATQEIGVTLGHIKQLLKTNGLLLVNEATKKQDFGTLTFGLTEGWWLFRDDEVRIPGTPLLSVAAWRAMLEANGFRGVRAFGLPGSDGGESEQSVIVAEGDGGVLLKKDTPGIAATPKKTPAPTARKPVTPTAEGGADVEKTIVDILARVIHIQSSEFDPHLSFQDYGVDSLLAVEIIDALNEALSTELRPTDLFNHATIRELARYISDHSAPRIKPETQAAGARQSVGPDVSVLLSDILAEVIHIDSSQFDPDMSFQDYGVDSLLAVEIIDKINSRMGLTLQPTDLFNYATLRELANFIGSEGKESPPDDELFGLLRQVENGELSTDDAERLLERYHD